MLGWGRVHLCWESGGRGCTHVLGWGSVCGARVSPRSSSSSEELAIPTPAVASLARTPPLPLVAEPPGRADRTAWVRARLSIPQPASGDSSMLILESIVASAEALPPRSSIVSGGVSKHCGLSGESSSLLAEALL